jgi:transposase, IS30 family
MSYTHLSPVCRGRIQAMHEQGTSLTAIAAALGRHRTTISRELARNGKMRGYDAAGAQRRYQQRRKACRPKKKLEYQPLRDYVFDHLPSGHSPEQVAGRLSLKYPHDSRMRISHEALYQALYSDERMHCLIEHLAQARAKRRTRGQGKSRRGPAIPNRVGIEHRPPVVDARSRDGDWEGDTIVGSHQHGFIATVTERRSLFLRARKTRTKEAQEVADAIIEELSEMPASWLKTLTLDNGTEFAKHQQIADSLELDVYFADPYASYQRGTNENTNGLLRRYFPKGTDFRTITQRQLDAAVEEINNRPRKKLGYRTPNEVFHEYLQNARRALHA